jgi:hypothetical protein
MPLCGEGAQQKALSGLSKAAIPARKQAEVAHPWLTRPIAKNQGPGWSVNHCADFAVSLAGILFEMALNSLLTFVDCRNVPLVKMVAV